MRTNKSDFALALSFEEPHASQAGVPRVSMLGANRRHPFHTILNVVKGMVIRERPSCIKRVRLEFRLGRIHYGIGENGVFIFRNAEGLPGSSGAHSSITTAAQEYLIEDMEGRKNATRIKIRDVEDQPEQISLSRLWSTAKPMPLIRQFSQLHSRFLSHRLKRFASTRARRASGSARLVRASAVHGRRDRAAGYGVRRQSPTPPAPRLSACPPFLSRRQCRASFRQRTSRASAHTSHPIPPGWSRSARKFALSPARSCFRIVAQDEDLRNISSTGAQLRAKSFLEGSNNFSAEIGDLRVRQRCVAALERYAHEQRIFSGGNILAAKEIGRFDRMDFADS